MSYGGDAYAHAPEPVRFIHFQVSRGYVYGLDTEGQLWGMSPSGHWGRIPGPVRPRLAEPTAAQVETAASGFVTCPYCWGEKSVDGVLGRVTCFACQGKGVVVVPPLDNPAS
jgi:hypothetical protein